MLVWFHNWNVFLICTHRMFYTCTTPLPARLTPLVPIDNAEALPLEEFEQLEVGPCELRGVGIHVHGEEGKLLRGAFWLQTNLSGVKMNQSEATRQVKCERSLSMCLSEPKICWFLFATVSLSWHSHHILQHDSFQPNQITLLSKSKCLQQALSAKERTGSPDHEWP